MRTEPGLREFVDTVVSEWSHPIDHDFAMSFVASTSTDVLRTAQVDALAEGLMKVPLSAWQEMFNSLLAYDDHVDVPRINVPALLVWGDAVPLVPRSMQEELMRCMCCAELVVYPGAGHTPRWELPETFACDVAEFALDLPH